MKKFTRDNLGWIASIVLLLILIAPYLMGSWGESRYWPGNTVYVDAKGRTGPSSVTEALNYADAGDVIFIYPGTYTVPSKTVFDGQVSFVGMGATYDDVVLTTTDSLTIGSNWIAFANLSILGTGSGTLFDNSGGYGEIKFEDCRIRCSTFVMQDSSYYFEHCQFEPLKQYSDESASEGWVITGLGCEVYMNDCQLGYNHPAFNSDSRGFCVTDDAILYVYNLRLFPFASGEPTAIFIDSAKAVFNMCDIITSGKAFVTAADASLTLKHCFVESKDSDEYAINTVDSTTLHIVNSTIKNVGSMKCMLLRSAYSNNTIFNSHLRGDVVCDSACYLGVEDSCASGNVYFIGYNSIDCGLLYDSTGSNTDGDNPGVVFGNLDVLTYTKLCQFTGTAAIDTVYIRGIKNSSSVQATLRRQGVVSAIDARLSTFVCAGGDTVIVIRPSDGTSDLQYFLHVKGKDLTWTDYYP